MDGPFGVFVPGASHGDGTWRALAQIDDCEVELEDEKRPFGGVRSAVLNMRVPFEVLVPVGFTGDVEAFPPRQKGVKVKIRGGKTSGSYAVFDTPQHVEHAKGRELSALVLMAREKEGGFGCGAACGEDVSREAFHCVVVARVEGDREEEELPSYERLGNEGRAGMTGEEGEGLERFVFV
ncbi:hypothetical protein L13192_02973 [Pyrenophora tritici-repentis]|nr:hypothetical protein L13192_02973 [Pyrenophora tritici-repentis]